MDEGGAAAGVDGVAADDEAKPGLGDGADEVAGTEAVEVVAALPKLVLLLLELADFINFACIKDARAAASRRFEGEMERRWLAPFGVALPYTAAAARSA